VNQVLNLENRVVRLGLDVLEKASVSLNMPSTSAVDLPPSRRLAASNDDRKDKCPGNKLWRAAARGDDSSPIVDATKAVFEETKKCDTSMPRRRASSNVMRSRVEPERGVCGDELACFVAVSSAAQNFSIKLRADFNLALLSVTATSTTAT
jgi:hypothetical protein